MTTCTADDGTTLAYEVTGEGPPLVLVHGITECGASWAPLVPRLAVDHRVIVIDLRGHGASGHAPPYDLLTFASDLRSVLDAEGVGGDAVLVGHSLGGTVVTAFAGAFACRAVMNVDQPLALGDFQAGLRQLEPLLRGSEADFAAAISAVFESMRGALDADETQRIESLRRPDREVVLGVWSVVLESELDDLDALVAAMTSGIVVPYLSLHGIDPGPAYADWLHQHIPGAEVEVWDGVGHYPHLVDPDLFVTRLHALLSSLS